jgi:hypothetical protein
MHRRYDGLAGTLQAAGRRGTVFVRRFARELVHHLLVPKRIPRQVVRFRDEVVNVGLMIPNQQGHKIAMFRQVWRDIEPVFKIN